MLEALSQPVRLAAVTASSNGAGVLRHISGIQGAAAGLRQKDKLRTSAHRSWRCEGAVQNGAAGPARFAPELFRQPPRRRPADLQPRHRADCRPQAAAGRLARNGGHLRGAICPCCAGVGSPTASPFSPVLDASACRAVPSGASNAGRERPRSASAPPLRRAGSEIRGSGRGSPVAAAARPGGFQVASGPEPPTPHRVDAERCPRPRV